jgi:hypothetical protein
VHAVAPAVAWTPAAQVAQIWLLPKLQDSPAEQFAMGVQLAQKASNPPPHDLAR